MNDRKAAGSKEISGMICAAASGVLFGTMPLMTKTAYAMGSNAYTVAFGRFLTGALFSGIFLLVRYGTVFGAGAARLRKIAVLSLFFSVMPCLLYGSYQYIDSGLATTLHFTYPVVVMVISVLVFREKLSRISVICILLCAAGILLLYPSKGAGEGSAMGMLLAAGSGVVYAFYIIGVDRSGLRELPVLVTIFWLSLFSSAEVFLFSALTGRLLLNLTWRVWLPYAGLGLIAMVLAASLFQIGIMRCGAVKSSLLSTIEPVTGIVIGVLVFHEALAARSVAGIALILLAVCALVLPSAGRPAGDSSET